MAYYLVRALPRKGRMRVLEEKLELEVFDPIRPFGSAMAESLRRARVDEEGRVWWEEEDYCSPPLAEEREAVLDHYFTKIEVEQVAEGLGWKEIEDLPRLFPEQSS